MEINQDFPFTTKEGHEYLIKFSQFNPDNIPDEITIPVVDVAIELALSANQTNNAGTLFQISALINNYIIKHDVILYCYCDMAPIDKRNAEVSNQQFRSLLFTRMFDKQNNQEYINERIVIEDEVNGSHYIHLFSHIRNRSSLELIVSELIKFNK